MLHHGSTAVHWDVEGGRSCLVFVRLERSCSLISWTRPAWSSLRTSGVQGPDYNLSANPEEGICGKWIGKLVIFKVLCSVGFSLSKKIFFKLKLTSFMMQLS